MKIVFMGSPEFAIPSLESLFGKFDVVGVVTQPDKPAGRGKELKPPPIKDFALKFGIDVIQPDRLRDQGVKEKLEDWKPDVIVVVAFGQILRQDVLDLPKYGCINVHGSLLPRWRGAAPIQAAILHGDATTGITIMRMDAGVDTGPILRQKEIPIQKSDTAESLSNSLSELGASLLVNTLSDYLQGKVIPVPQPETGITYASTLKKEDGSLDFSKGAIELDRQVRAFYPWPGTFMTINGERIKVISTSVISDTNLSIGKRDVFKGFPIVGTGEGGLLLETVQPAGKKPMAGKIFLNGFRNW
ncbi:MAG TPA: methionyl-tRNA formyltransferase [Anaerolineaceae bacterium]|nr:methionyl-tRNA formyltransferase [Anaerolineaceae bacterium]